MLAKVLELQAEALSIFEAVKADLEGTTPLDAAREVGRLLELEAKLTGAFAPKQVEVTSHGPQTPAEALALFDRMRPALEAQAAEDAAAEGAKH